MLGPYTEGDDAATMIAVASGDRGALAALYDRHGERVLALARRILGDEDDAEDLLHDVFIEAWRRAGGYDPARASVRGWLLLLTRSRALDRKRSAARSRRASYDEEGAYARERDVRPPSEGGTIHAALGDLPESQREVLMLAYFEGLTSSEIAARVGVSLGTVKSRTAAALSKLRTRLRAGSEP